MGVLAMSTLILSGCGYNQMHSDDEDVKMNWSEVLNQYQHRTDLVSALINLVKSEPKFEPETLARLVEAHKNIQSIQATPKLINDPKFLFKFQQAQGRLNLALSGLFIASQGYNNLRANTDFIQIQTQLKDAENQITVARDRYIKSMQQYNSTINTFPNNLIAWLLGYQTRPNIMFNNELDIPEPPLKSFW